MLLRVQADAAESSQDAPVGTGAPGLPPPTLDAFLAGVDARAFRFAEVALRQREDALDAVQDAMARMLAYRERAPAEWTPLFWRILRTRVVDLQRRRGFRLRWLLPAEDAAPDWREHAPSRTPGARTSSVKPGPGCRPRWRRCRGGNARPSPCACWKSWTSPPPRRRWAAARAR